MDTLDQNIMQQSVNNQSEKLLGNYVHFLASKKTLPANIPTLKIVLVASLKIVLVASIR